MRRIPTLTPEQYSRVAFWALFMLMGIVMTGAGVRLTGSGLGCPDWPQCGGGVAPPLQTHALIEFGNRVLSGLVGITAAAAGLLAFRRRPYRRDLAVIGLLLPLGVIGQAVLGGFTVKYDLAPGFVMGHYILSMLLLTAAVALLWRSRARAGQPPAVDRPGDGLGRAGARAARRGDGVPGHGGDGVGSPRGRRRHRRRDRPPGVARDRHAQLGRAPARADGDDPRVRRGHRLILVRRRGNARALRSMTLLCCLIAAQGTIGLIQYNTKLPSEIVWVHVCLAAFIWVSILFAASAAGRLVPRAQEARSVARSATG